MDDIISHCINVASSSVLYRQLRLIFYGIALENSYYTRTRLKLFIQFHMQG